MSGTVNSEIESDSDDYAQERAATERDESIPRCRICRKTFSYLYIPGEVDPSENRPKICEGCLEESKVKHGFVLPRDSEGHCQDERHRCLGECERWFCTDDDHPDRKYVPKEEVEALWIRLKRPSVLRDGKCINFRNWCTPCYQKNLKSRQ